MEEQKDYVNIKIVKHEKVEFSKKVIDFARNNQVGYLEAACEIADSRKIEIEIVAKLITDELKLLIEDEAKRSRLVKVEEPKCPNP